MLGFRRPIVQSDPGEKRADLESAQKAGPPQIRADWIWAKLALISFASYRPVGRP